jgi:hypothetical protein
MEAKAKQTDNTLPEGNLFELMIEGEIFYSMNEYEYKIPFNKIRNAQLSNIPDGVEIYLENIWESLESPLPDFDVPTFSLYKESEDNCLVHIVTDLPEDQWDYDISQIVYLNLKYKLICKNPAHERSIQGEDPDSNRLVYCIKGNGRTVGEILKNALEFDRKIAQEIDLAATNVESLLFQDICNLRKKLKNIAL